MDACMHAWSARERDPGNEIACMWSIMNESAGLLYPLNMQIKFCSVSENEIQGMRSHARDQLWMTVRGCYTLLHANKNFVQCLSISRLPQATLSRGQAQESSSCGSEPGLQKLHHGEMHTAQLLSSDGLIVCFIEQLHWITCGFDGLMIFIV